MKASQQKKRAPDLRVQDSRDLRPYPGPKAYPGVKGRFEVDRDNNGPFEIEGVQEVYPVTCRGVFFRLGGPGFRAH